MRAFNDGTSKGAPGSGFTYTDVMEDRESVVLQVTEQLQR